MTLSFEGPLKCLCIKDGFMRDGSQFCYVGHEYDYTYYKSLSHIPSHPYNVRTGPPGGCDSHSMGDEFFSEYFTPIVEILEKELFEI